MQKKKIQLKNGQKICTDIFFPQRSYSDGQQIDEKGGQYH